MKIGVSGGVCGDLSWGWRYELGWRFELGVEI